MFATEAEAVACATDGRAHQMGDMWMAGSAHSVAPVDAHEHEHADGGHRHQRYLRRQRYNNERHRRSSGNAVAGHGDEHAQVFVDIHVYQFGKIGKHKVWLSALIMLFVLVLIALELLHKTLAAFVGGLLTFSLMMACHMLPNIQTVVVWIDESTVILLFGMMIMIGKLAETGLFGVMTAKVVEVSKGDLGYMYGARFST
jgi:hypothetical protein